MTTAKQLRDWMLRSRPRTPALVLAIALGLLVTAHTQTFQVIHNFTGAGDGQQPEGGLTVDKAGNLYGTASHGGGLGSYGLVFKLKPAGSGWIFSSLFNFEGTSGGTIPLGGVVFGPDGTLYGTTAQGGPGECYGNGLYGCGTVFNLRPPASACKAALCPWMETLLYEFMSGDDGSTPSSQLIFDPAGNLFGTTNGGQGASSTVFEMAHFGAGWTEAPVAQLPGTISVTYPGAGVIFDTAGNLYGTWFGSFDNSGSVYKLTPSNGGWTYTSIHDFTGGSDGGNPLCTLVMDQAGNLYGTTSAGGDDRVGTVFEMSPSNGGWTFKTIYTFESGTDGSYAGLVMDAAGDLYGTKHTGGGFEVGNVFELSPTNGGWTYTDLHDFNGSDGRFPDSQLVIDAKGNLFGSTPQGGTCCGVVWEIKP